VKNAPVIYVIVQVRLAPVLSLQTYIFGDSEHFAETAFLRLFNVQLSVGAIRHATKTTQNRRFAHSGRAYAAYVFSNRDSSQSFVLGTEWSHVTRNGLRGFQSVSRPIPETIEPYQRGGQADSSERIGLRYLTQFCHNEGAKIQNYFIPEVLGLSSKPLAGSLATLLLETMFRNGDTSTVSRVLSGMPDCISTRFGFVSISINPRFTGQVGSRDD